MKQSKVKQIEVEPAIVPESPEKYSGKAYFVKKHSYLLSQAYELVIENGVVKSETPISVSDMPATTTGVASKALWKQLRGEK